MSKKKKAKASFLGTIIILVGLVIAIVGAICLSINAVNLTIKATANSDPSVTGLITGFGLAFGAPYEIKAGDFTYTAEPEMNTNVLIFFIVLAIGIVFGLLALILKLMRNKKVATILGLVGGLVTLVGGILFFFVPNVLDADLIEAVQAFNSIVGFLGGSASLTLGAGSIIPAIGGTIGGVAIGIGSIVR